MKGGTTMNSSSRCVLVPAFILALFIIGVFAPPRLEAQKERKGSEQQEYSTDQKALNQQQKEERNQLQERHKAEMKELKERHKAERQELREKHEKQKKELKGQEAEQKEERIKGEGKKAKKGDTTGGGEAEDDRGDTAKEDKGKKKGKK
jgi:hypothetical protein